MVPRNGTRSLPFDKLLDHPIILYPCFGEILVVVVVVVVLYLYWVYIF